MIYVNIRTKLFNMFASNDRKELRQFYFDIWQKYQTKQALEPLERQVLQIMLQHPEYHKIFNEPDSYLHADYLPESGNTNPFLHLSLHQALLEQLSTDRPKGIQAIYAQLIQRAPELHEVEHRMMEVLAELLWESMQQQAPITDEIYLSRLKQLIL